MTRRVAMKNVHRKRDPRRGWGLIIIVLILCLSCFATPVIAQQVKVPNVVGWEFKKAQNYLTSLGLQNQYVGANWKKTDMDDKRTDNKNLDRTIWIQAPAAGTLVPMGTIVKYALYVYDPEVVVPNVVGATSEQAKEDLKKYGFLNVYFKYQIANKEYNDPKLIPGIISEQSVSAGKKYPVGTLILLTVREEKQKVTVPNLRNLTTTEAGKKLSELKLHGPANYKNIIRKEEDGRVLDQNPAPGSTLLQGDSVNVTVGKYSEQNIEVRFGLDASKTAYVLAVSGGAQPYSVSLQPKGNWIVGIFAVNPLPDNPKDPGWKLFRITSRADDQVTLIIKDSQGRSHSYTKELKKLSR
jgi:beta-lactam-binding protein with PASTA domain